MKPKRAVVKEVIGKFKLQAPSGQANPSPPIGPALGQRGINIMEFCKKFNDATKDMDSGVPVPVEITIYKDKSFTFKTFTPLTSYYLKKAAKLESGSAEPVRKNIGKVSKKELLEIAKLKFKDLNAFDLKQAVKIIAGSARSMGIEVKDE